MKKQTETLHLALNGRKFGSLVKAPRGELSFKYHSRWLNDDTPIPLSLSMPLREQAYVGEIVASYFGNLLPDSDAILKRIAERLGAKSGGTFDLLAEIGRDCVGAVQLIPEQESIPPLQKANGTSLNAKEVREILDNLGRRPLGLSPENGFRLSIAGAQEKAAFLWQNGKWHRPTGATPTTHIFKPSLGIIRWDSGDVDMSDSVWNEHYCLELFKNFRFNTAETQVHNFAGRDVLCVERFDRFRRKDDIFLRLPQEDLCQSLAVPSSRKYQNEKGPTLVDILNLLRRSDVPHEDQQTVFRAQVLFFLIGATDGHAKNFSIFLRHGGQFQLTPLYDILSTQPAFDRQQIQHKDYRLAMSVGRKTHYKIMGIHGRHFLETAIAANLPESFAREAICHIQDWMSSAFDRTIRAMPKNFPHEIHDSIYTAAKKRLPRLDSAFG